MTDLGPLPVQLAGMGQGVNRPARPVRQITVIVNIPSQNSTIKLSQIIDETVRSGIQLVCLRSLHLDIYPKINVFHTEAPEMALLVLKGCSVLSEALIDCLLLATFDASFYTLHALSYLSYLHVCFSYFTCH
ncbi:hypothetical protein T459_22362 [Capsicum annuum]|uniref:Uncharacterized protein n=1 Tax=Capsicum annuum TaxID=4072 RepID=A0A2G2YPA1_CAPAN|nr:hypothetical protein T459_22362 [Capsicum annuum]